MYMILEDWEPEDEIKHRRWNQPQSNGSSLRASPRCAGNLDFLTCGGRSCVLKIDQSRTFVQRATPSEVLANGRPGWRELKSTRIDGRELLDTDQKYLMLATKSWHGAFSTS